MIPLDFLYHGHRLGCVYLHHGPEEDENETEDSNRSDQDEDEESLENDIIEAETFDDIFLIEITRSTPS